ncbi:MAG: 2OG-Fe(II) oxygenase [Hyphomonadaceae bacterium]
MMLQDAAAHAACADGADWLSRLASEGWAIREGVLPPALVAALREEAERQYEAGQMERAGIGRADDHTLDREVRRDRVMWLEGETLAQVQFLEAMELLRLELNRELFLGLFELEAHFAVYEAGAFYVRHVDAFRGERNRIVSVVLYLNPDWREGDGGELAIYAPDAEEAAAPIALAQPRAGAMAVFLSEEIPHEVLTAKARRYSIAGWFRVREELPAA